MKVEALPDGRYLISDDDARIELNRTSYEDLFYAIPIDNGSLYLLLNDTILEASEARAALKVMLDKHGGIEPTMALLQDQVKVVEPSAEPVAAPAEEPNPFADSSAESGDFVRVTYKEDKPAADIGASFYSSDEEAPAAEVAPAKAADDLKDFLVSDPDAPAAKPAKVGKTPAKPAAEKETPRSGVKPSKEPVLHVPSRPKSGAWKLPPKSAPAPEPTPEPEPEDISFAAEEEVAAPAPVSKPGKAAPPPAKPPVEDEDAFVDLDSLGEDEEAIEEVIEEAPAPPPPPVKEKPKKPVPAAKEPPKPVAKTPAPAKPAPPAKPADKPAAKKPEEVSFSDDEFDNLPDLADDEEISLTETAPAKPAAAAKAPPPAKPGIAAKAPAPGKPEPVAAKTPAGKPATAKTPEPAPVAAEKKVPSGAIKPGPRPLAPGQKGRLALAKAGPDEFQLTYGEHVVSLTKARYEKLFETCPIDTSSLFRILMAEILDGPGKAVFRKIIAAAGHSKPILDALNEQVQKVDPD